MSNFDDRQKAFEAQFVNDQETVFRVNARKNKLLGLWAAEKLSKTGEDAQHYALHLVEDAINSKSFNAAESVLKDLDDAGLAFTLKDVREAYEEVLHQAVFDITGEKPE